MSMRKVTIKIELSDSKINSIEDLEREILSQDIMKKVAEEYLNSLQDDMAKQMPRKKGSKKIHIKTTTFEFDINAKRFLDENGGKKS